MDTQQQSDEQLDNPALRKVNPGPSSARIYRSNTPLSAQPIGKFGTKEHWRIAYLGGLIIEDSC